MFARFNLLRKVYTRLAAIFAVMALAACDPGALGSLTGGPSLNSSGPVQVALLIPRGSSQRGDEVIANDLERAARLAMSSLNGVEIDLRVYATRGDAATAGAQAQKAVAEGAKIILGPLRADAAAAAGVAVEAQNVNVLAFSNNTDIAGANIFVLGSTFQNTANRLVQFASSQGKRNIVVVHGQNAGGSLGLRAIQNAITQSGSTLSGVVSYPLSQQDVVQAVPRVRSTVEATGADAVFLTAPPAGALPLLAQLLPEAGVNPAVTRYIGLTRWDIPNQTLSLPGVQGGWFALPDPARSSAFSNRFTNAYGASPHPLAALAFDGMAAVGALAARSNNRSLSGAALTQGAGFQGANGIFRFLKDGTNQRGMAVATVRDRQVIILSQAPQSFGGAGF